MSFRVINACGLAAFVLAPALAEAKCVTTGQITRVVQTPNSPAISFYVQSVSPPARVAKYSTNDAGLINGVLAAQQKHMVVEVTGVALSCAASNVISGGGVETVVKKYQPAP